MSNELHACIVFGNVQATIVHQGCAGNPDVTLDTVNRLAELFKEACEIASQYQPTCSCNDDDEPDDGETIA